MQSLAERVESTLRIPATLHAGDVVGRTADGLRLVPIVVTAVHGDACRTQLEAEHCAARVATGLDRVAVVEHNEAFHVVQLSATLRPTAARAVGIRALAFHGSSLRLVAPPQATTAWPPPAPLQAGARSGRRSPRLQLHASGR